MAQIDAQRFIDEAARVGVALYIGVPCSHLGPIIDQVLASSELRYVAAANEGDAVALASGAALGGRSAMVLLQNSGLGNAVNPLSSLNEIARIPILLLVSWRGEPTGAPDEPQHAHMGAITGALLDLLKIRWELLPTNEAELAPAMARASLHLREQRRPYALVVRKGTFARSCGQPRVEPTGAPCRLDFLAAVQRAAAPSDVLVATTGYTGRELESLADRPNQFYLVGAMGCASSVGMGLAWAQPQRRVIVLDGDGAALMRLSALATLGAERPPNLLHLLFDNEAYESTGAQRSASHTTDLAAVAAACGYPCVRAATAPDELAQIVAAPTSVLTLVHVKTPLFAAAHLSRPKLGPIAVAERLRHWLTAST